MDLFCFEMGEESWMPNSIYSISLLTCCNQIHMLKHDGYNSSLALRYYFCPALKWLEVLFHTNHWTSKNMFLGSTNLHSGQTIIRYNINVSPLLPNMPNYHDKSDENNWIPDPTCKITSLISLLDQSRALYERRIDENCAVEILRTTTDYK